MNRLTTATPPGTTRMNQSSLATRVPGYNGIMPFSNGTPAS
jgi:hypothetical protein